MVHTIVTGGQALLDTLHGAAQLVKQLDAARFVIWLNPFWGPVADNGRSFEQMNLYETIKKRIETIVSRMCCDFVVEPKIGVDDWKFSSSPRTDRE